jgi:hypothetical protein
MQLIVTAVFPDPCNAILSSANETGSPVGGSLPVDLEPGQTASLPVNADTLGLQRGQRMEVQPIVSVVPLLTAGPRSTTTPGELGRIKLARRLRPFNRSALAETGEEQTDKSSEIPTSWRCVTD